ncbi:hypothetical protein [Nitrospira sp. Nam74]
MDLVLEIGFGGSYTLQIMATLVSAGKAYGADFSESMAQFAERFAI